MVFNGFLCIFIFSNKKLPNYIDKNADIAAAFSNLWIYWKSKPELITSSRSCLLIFNPVSDNVVKLMSWEHGFNSENSDINGCVLTHFLDMHATTPWAQDVNWTSYVRSIYVMCPGSKTAWF